MDMRKSSLPKLRPRGWLAVGSVLCLLVLLALFSHQTVQQSRDNVMYLADDDLPLLTNIQQLNVQLLKIQAILYNYYLTADSDLFAEQFPAGFDTLSSTYGAIEEEIPEAPGLSSIGSLIHSLLAISASLDTVMRKSPVDWDQSRSILAEMDPVIQQMDANSLQLGSWIGRRITTASRESLQKIETTLHLISAMGLASLLAAAIMVWVNARRLAAMEEQHRLASFPEQNPRPVLALDRDGTVTYTNGGAAAMAREVFGVAVVQLLPANLVELLSRAKANGKLFTQEYSLADRYLHIGLHWLE
ncbi:hypothetical protein [Haliea sp.]